MGHSLVTPNAKKGSPDRPEVGPLRRAGMRRASWARLFPRLETGESVVIVGAGMASFKLCERLVALAGRGKLDVTVVGAEPTPPYDRVNLNKMFAGATRESLQLADPDWYARNDIKLICGDPAVLIERYDQLVVTQSNQEIYYDHLVLATGARANLPEIDITCPHRVFVYRSIDDLSAILHRAESASSVAVIGGGLLGVEAAKGLSDLGMATTIVDYSSGLLARHLCPEAAEVFNRNFSNLGIDVQTHQVTRSIHERGEQVQINFVNAKPLVVDFVIMATGVRPCDELARESGLALGPRGGIKVDANLLTSDPRIYAIGDCASFEGNTFGLAAPGFIMADVLAERLNGRRRKFGGLETTCSLKVPECPMHAVGEYQFDGATFTYSNETHFRQLVCEGRKLVGATVVGDWDELPRVQEAITARRRLGRRQLDQFKKNGLLWPKERSNRVDQWPVRAVVCNCMRVERGALSKALAAGCTTVEMMARETGASTVCGSCKPLLAQLVGAPPSSVVAPAWKPFLIVSVVSAVVALVWFLVPAIQPVDSVQGGWKVETLWTDPFWKQVSGYSILGMMLVSLGISVRKRVPRVRLGEFGWWRLAHGLLGALCLLVLVTHTGLSLGQNLNFLLITNFLVLGLWGGLAGTVTALEHRLAGNAGRRIRQVWTWIHVALVWPLPPLIAAHIISVYWY